MAISETYNMDCMEYMRTMPDNFFDLAVVDPPFGSGTILHTQGKQRWNRFGGIFDRYKGQQDGRNLGGKVRKKIIGWDEAPQPEYFKELFRVSRQQIIWGANYFPSMPPTRCFLVWKKTNIPENFSMAMCEYAWTSFNGNAKVFEASSHRNKQSGKFHPTEKPVALYLYIYRTFAKPGDKILDTHLGSGSSRIAAYNMGFDFYGCEIDADYFCAQEERFRRECFGEVRIADGKVYKQTELFEE